MFLKGPSVDKRENKPRALHRVLHAPRQRGDAVFSSDFEVILGNLLSPAISSSQRGLSEGLTFGFWRLKVAKKQTFS